MRTAAALLLLASAARADTIDVPGDYASVQAALDASVAGDTILVQPGTYPEAIVLPGHDLVLRGAGMDLTVLDADGLKASVISANAPGPWTITIEDLSVTGGQGTPQVNGSTNGGGLRASLDDGSQLTLRRCRFTGNSARTGGAAYVGLHVSFEQCEITGNVADSAGGIYGFQTTLIRCVIAGNRALKYSGGGLYGSFTLRDCLVAENEAVSAGGGLFGSAAKQDWERCRFVDNSAGNGGGCWISGSDYFGFAPVLQNAIFLGNRASIQGGAAFVSMYDFDCDVPAILVRNCIFSGNTSAGAPWGLAADHNCSSLPTRVENCTFLGEWIAADVAVTDSIAWGSQPIAYVRSVAWSDVQGGWPGPGNIDADPLLADTAAAGAHLQASSPCRDAGDPSVATSDATDFEGEPRVQYLRVDMGVDEYAADCNANALPDWMDVQAGTSLDCEADGVPDECEPFLDCNGNGVRDECDIAIGLSADCNDNKVPDECEPLADCDGNGVSDWCQSGDCNGNGVPDLCDLLAGTSADADGNGLPDECQQILFVPGDWPTLQAAVNAASPGASIVLSPGVHAGEGNRDVVVGKPLLIVGLTSAAECVLDGEDLGRLISAQAGVPLTLGRLTLRHGLVTSVGGAALFLPAGAAATVRDCVLQDNAVPGWSGGAVMVRNGASLQMERCVLSGNSAATGGALTVNSGAATLSHCTLNDNVSTQFGLKASGVRVTGGGQLVLHDAILRRGAALPGPVLEVQGAGSLADVSWCDVEGGESGVSVSAGATLAWGGGNFDADPLFKDAAASDFRLSGGSPCIDTGNPSGAADDDGTPPDMGALPFQPFEDVGFALAGAGGEPQLAGLGTATAGDALTLQLTGALPFAPATLVVGAAPLLAPFKGGVMVPALHLLLPPLAVGADGTLDLGGQLPAGTPSGAMAWTQFWIPDAGGPQGFAASNGLTIEVR